KWRYRAHASLDSGLIPFKTLLADYFKTQHSFGHPVLAQQKQLHATHLDLLLDSSKQAKQRLSESYGLDLGSILFFMSLPTQVEFECQCGQSVKPEHIHLQEFVASRQTTHLPAMQTRLKLSQIDKYILIDLEQMLVMKPYDYLQVAQD